MSTTETQGVVSTVLDDVFAKINTTVPEIEALAERYAGKLALDADPVVLDVDEGIKIVRALWHAVQVAKAPPAAAEPTTVPEGASGDTPAPAAQGAAAPPKPAVRQ